MTNSYKKESPLAGFAGFGGGAPGLSYKSAATKIYVDEVFSTQAYIGNESNRTITNGLDLSTEGGLVWSKSRTGSSAMLHLLYDTERGVTKDISSQSNGTEGTSTTMITAFNTNGYNIGTSGYVNENNSTFASWSFRKSKGFFDIVTWTGNGSARTISHSLGSVPGCIMVKCLSTARDWNVYHKSTGEGWYLELNEANAKAQEGSGGVDTWNDTKPTATNFSLGSSWDVNKDGQTYIAYLFGGGESTDDGARSVYFDGSNEWLKIANSNNTLGTSNFTIECWIQPDNMAQQRTIFDMRSSTSESDGFGLFLTTDYTVYGYIQGNMFIGNGQLKLTPGSWNHVAVVRDASDSIKLYVNGIQSGETYTSNPDFNNSNGDLVVGGNAGGGQLYQGRISNLRLNKGQALYTTAFRPPTEPLTTTSQGSTASNVEVLCCQNSSASGVASGTNAITSTSGTPSSSAAQSPFDDSAGFNFGDSKQGIIKCDKYLGNGNANGPEVYLGWEPQYVLIKNATASSREWRIHDNLRGLARGAFDETLLADTADNRTANQDVVDVNPLGFKITSSNAHYNESGETMIYIAIRRSDGYVGKPADSAINVFNIDTGNSSSTIPTYDSTFPVDFAIQRQTASSDPRMLTRLQGQKSLLISTAAEAGADSIYQWDSNVGFCGDSSGNTNWLSWMWKRYEGMDVLNYTGNGHSGKCVPHSLGKAPEMIWIKRLNGTSSPIAGHIGLNGGSNPWHYELGLHINDSEANSASKWNDTAPTSSHFTLGNSTHVNDAGEPFIAYLFRSVSGISKCGYYTGNGSTQTITTGFQPRFLIIRSSSNTSNWLTLDTTRGWGSGNDNVMYLNNGSELNSSYNVIGPPVSTGFELINAGELNENNWKYIYYAHA